MTFPRAAHPRSRGENALCCAGVGEYPGSSPLTRGKHVQESRGLAPSRLIPAHAGKTSGCKTVIARSPAHPRSRGENGWSARRALPSRGSSPLTRGKPIRVAKMRARHRLIPAHAGKTHFRRRNERGHWAHPRSRGENDTHRIVGDLQEGSSPLTRGKQRRRHGDRHPPRLIPAHAGKTPRRKRFPRVGRAHPRSRGENDHVASPAHYELGSSPLTRGKRPPRPVPAAHGRLIPAHAGKTSTAHARLAAWAAHPRSRGENQAYFPVQDTNAGSSPLTRGKPHPDSHATVKRRLIPAHAGKTRRHVWRVSL